MEKRKIAHIVQAEGAGVTDYIKMLVEKMDKTKYNVTVVGSLYYEKERSMLEHNGVRLITLDMVREINLKKDINAILALRRILKVLDADVLHIHSSKAGVIGRVANIGLRAKSIYNAHGWAFNMKISHEKIKVYSIVEKLLSKFTDKIVNISDDEYDSAVKVGINPKKMIIIKNAIDVDKVVNSYNNEETLQELHIPKDAFIIGICGRISEQKSPEVFIKVCKNIAELIPNAYFLMIGDGELREFVLEEAKKSHIQDLVKITGWTGEPQKYISILDVALLTSKWEGFGLVLLHYMIGNKPIVAARVGGIPEIIKDEDTGILVEWNDVEAYVKAIIKLRSDSVLRKRLTSNAYKTVIEKFNLKELVKEHEQLYNTL